MKTHSKPGIVFGGPGHFRHSKAYMEKAEHVRTVVQRKYEERLSKERNPIRKLLLKLWMRLELRRSLNQPDSPANLHIQGRSSNLPPERGA